MKVIKNNKPFNPIYDNSTPKHFNPIKSKQIFNLSQSNIKQRENIKQKNLSSSIIIGRENPYKSNNFNNENNNNLFNGYYSKSNNKGFIKNIKAKVLNVSNNSKSKYNIFPNKQDNSNNIKNNTKINKNKNNDSLNFNKSFDTIFNRNNNNTKQINTNKNILSNSIYNNTNNFKSLIKLKDIVPSVPSSKHKNLDIKENYLTYRNRDNTPIVNTYRTLNPKYNKDESVNIYKKKIVTNNKINTQRDQLGSIKLLLDKTPYNKDISIRTAITKGNNLLLNNDQNYPSETIRTKRKFVNDNKFVSKSVLNPGKRMFNNNNINK